MSRKAEAAPCGRAFRPFRVVELNLEIGRPLPDLDRLGGYGSVFGVVRLHGVPLGYVEAPVVAGRCSGRYISELIVNQHGDAILRHLLSDALINGTLQRGPVPTDPPHSCGSWYEGPLPSLTIAVCTRDRIDDLSRCLASLERVDYPALDVLVVDNAPRDERIERLVRTVHPRMRYVREPRPGLNWARGRAVQEKGGELLAYVDDDVVVDAQWARAFACVMAENADVMAVTGLVAPYELESEPQLIFERRGGFGSGFVRQWLRRHEGELAGPTFANAGAFGTGANMAFRRAVFADVGLFDPALDAGTPAQAGGDLDLFFRIVKAGHTLVYDPSAMVRHRHRYDEAALNNQLRGWCMGMQACLIRSMHAYPAERMALASVAARLLLLYYPRRLVQSLANTKLRPRLSFAELRGAIVGLRRYGAARRQAIAVAARFGENPPSVSTVRDAPRRRLRPFRTVRVDLEEPLPLVLPAADSEAVRIEVMHSGQRLGTVKVACGGTSVSRMRVSDAIVAGLGRKVLDRADGFRRALPPTLAALTKGSTA